MEDECRCICVDTLSFEDLDAMSFSSSKKNELKRCATRELITRYLDAKEEVLSAGFAPEIDWQESRSLERICEDDFLRETAWVILSSGMREAVVRKVFARISEVFYEWRSAAKIVAHASETHPKALRIFAHSAKINAIHEVCSRVASSGFGEVRARLRNEGVAYLQNFPFVGPITCYHLAKNLGIEVVKPDRHLVRISAAAGYASVHDMCREIALCTGEKLSVVDVVLWRYSTLRKDYVSRFERS